MKLTKRGAIIIGLSILYIFLMFSQSNSITGEANQSAPNEHERTVTPQTKTN